ncbi:MAG TPA: DUF6175 family protein [Fibrobacteraceae bacterium]|nr:DUF6175 family protein [Fibrobacteraceae bacterium]
MKKSTIILLAMVVGLVWAGNQPKSHEASFKEAYSASEVTIKATGIGADDRSVNDDLLRAAVWFVLEGGTDPLLNTPEAKNAFASQAEAFYDMKNIHKYITWEAQKVNAQMKTPDGIKRTKAVRVNKGAIQADLSAKGVIKATSDLRDALGNPTIMVIPEVKTGDSPIKVFDTNNLARHAAGVIESRLTAKQYDVIVPRAQDQLAQMTEMQGQLADQDQDPAYQLALTLGSDVYIVFSGKIENAKASVVVKAYETTTGRLLGTETGYSKPRPGANMEPLVEEAVSDAIDRVLQRITNYWTEDLKKGVQYKVIFKMDASVPKDAIQDVQDDIAGVLDDNFKTKENIVTDKTMDYILWAKPDEFDKSSKIERFIRRQVKSAKISKININKKLILLKVEK